MTTAVDRDQGLAHRRTIQAAEHAEAALLLFDEDGRCLAANPAAGELTGYPPEDLPALPAGALDANHDEGVTHRAAAFHGLQRTGITHFLRSDGRVVRTAYAATVTRIDGAPALLTLCWQT